MSVQKRMVAIIFRNVELNTADIVTFLCLPFQILKINNYIKI